MNAELLVRHFDRISDARNAIPRLRRFIFELAVRGRLVDQDPKDEPASELLKRIRSEKARRVKDGKLKLQPPLPALDRMHLPYDLPSTWSWVRFGELVFGADAGWSPRTEPFPRSGDNWGVLRVSAVSWNKFLPGENKQLLSGSVPPEAAQVHAGDFLISRANTSDLVAKSVIVEQEPTNLILSDKIVRLQISENCSKKFISIVNNHAAYARAYYADEASGTSLSMQNVSRAVIYGLLIPLPPVAEQQRIVAKIDELVTLCDRLAAIREQRESRRDRLAASSLHHLDNGADAEAFRTHAQFFLNHLPHFTTHSEQLQQFRQAVLSLAVRGQLVPQDRTDEPAFETLQRIQAEKARLIKESLLRREKPLPLVAGDEAPFAIPTTWIWARIGNVSLLTEYGTSVKSDHSENGVPVLKMGDIQGGKVVLGGQKKVPRKIEDLPQLFLKRFDLLYNRTNSAELVGKTGIYIGDDDAYTFASYLIRIRFLRSLTNPVYANMAMNAPYFRTTQIVPELQQQCGQANVNGTKLRNMLIPLPPLAEQHRIVARVDALMNLCDRLERQIVVTQVEEGRHLEAVLHHAINDECTANAEQEIAATG